MWILTFVSYIIRIKDGNVESSYMTLLLICELQDILVFGIIQFPQCALWVKIKILLQDMALIEALWKQDVDLGVPREVFEEDAVETFTDAPTKDKDHGKKVQ